MIEPSRQRRVAPIKRRFTLRLEELETRTLLSAAAWESLLASPEFSARPLGSGGPAAAPFTPSQIRSAYGINNILFGSTVGDGTNQTIAIIDAFNNPTIVSDLAAFDTQFGLPAPPSFRVVNQSGGSILPANASRGGWDVEEALDVEWAHSVAPNASLILVEATNNSYANLISHAANWAKKQLGVSVISMSFGGGEFSTETGFDAKFKTPAGHNGVTFVASTGDSGSPGGYPAFSANVLAVGGTSLGINNSGNWNGETGWGGSGGGQSQFEAKPSFQNGVNTSAFRQIPDVAFDADPNTGVFVLDSYAGGYFEVGGTSLSAPCWAGLIAIANQGRVLGGLGTLKNTQAQSILYSLPATDFHDITSGNNGGFTAHAGYDLVTGIGTPIANLLVPDLAAHPSSNSIVISSDPQDTGTGGLVVQPATIQFIFQSGSLVNLAQVNVIAQQNVSATSAQVAPIGITPASLFAVPAPAVPIILGNNTGYSGAYLPLSAEVGTVPDDEGQSTQGVVLNPAVTLPDSSAQVGSSIMAQDTSALVALPEIRDTLFADTVWLTLPADQRMTTVALSQDPGVEEINPVFLAGLAVALGSYGAGFQQESKSRKRETPRL